MKKCDFFRFDLDRLIASLQAINHRRVSEVSVGDVKAAYDLGLDAIDTFSDCFDLDEIDD